MYRAILQYFLLILAIGVYTYTAAQSRIRFVSADGFGIANTELHVYSPFGLELRNYKDSSNGYYVHEAFNRIKATAPGYLPFDSIYLPEIPLGTSITCELTPLPELLNQVVVSANRNPLKIRESSVSISVLQPYLLQNKVPKDIGLALQQVPGVSMADDQINIRNGSGWSYGAGSRVAVLVDDLPMLSGDASQAQISYIPIENVRSVEIVKSAGSVLYGSSALNGVVHIRTATPESKPRASVVLYSGFFDKPRQDSLRWYPGYRSQSGIQGYFSQKVKNTGIAVTWNGLRNEGFREHEFENRARIGVKCIQDIPRIQGLQLGLQMTAQQGKSGSFLLWERAEKGYNSYQGGYNYSNTTRYNVDPYIQKSGKRFDHKISARFFVLDSKNDNGDPTNNQSNSSTLGYSEYRNHWKIIKNRIALHSGLVYMAAQTNSPLFSGKQKSKNIATYAQLEARGSRWNANVGFRYEYFSLNQTETTKPVMRIGANYRVSRTGNMRISYGQGFRFPSMAESFISTSVGPVTIYSNPSLKPEIGDNSEIGFKQGYKIGKFKAYVDAAVYYMRFSNMTEFTFAQWGDNSQPPTFGFGFKSVNTGKTSIRGFELETAGEGKIANTTFRLLAGYTYSDPISEEPKYQFAIAQNGTQKLSFSNTSAYKTNYLKYRYRHLIRADLQAEYKNFEAGISLRYNSKLLNMDTAFIMLKIISGTEKTSAAICDFRIAYKVNAHWKCNMQVTNIANTIYMARPADYRMPRTYQVQVVWTL